MGIYGYLWLVKYMVIYICMVGYNMGNMGIMF